MDATRAVTQHRQMNLRSTALGVTTLLAAGLLGCTSSGTRLINSWREPSAGPLRFKKVLVLCVAPHESQQRFGEAELVRLMKRTQGVSAHSVMTPDELKDETRMRAVMAREGFDGAVTLRFLGADQQLTGPRDVYYPAPATADFWSYSAVWAMASTPGYVHIDRKMQMETRVFSMTDDKVVWSGVSETTNPASAQTLVNDVVRTVAADLRKQRLID